ncbi:hypothetical protein [Nonomuraea sp. NPDC049695]|uniref:hypothetical protein n=1 Tax=Nonomuraea sp. NPDC049695 TaxID=3154734 RepID=UPI0034169A33
MALDVLPTIEAQARLTGRDPRHMCDGCRARRRAHLQTAAEWALLGSAGPALMILATTTLWWTRPVLPLVYRLTGAPALLPCSGPACAAHRRFEATPSQHR